MPVVEDQGPNRVRAARTLVAAVSAVTVVAASALLWRYAAGLADDGPDLGGVLLVASGGTMAGRHWLRGRARRADLRWSPAIVVSGGVHPGLLGRWSRLALALDVTGAAAFLGGGLLLSGKQVGLGLEWSGVIFSTLAAGATIAVAAAAFGRMRRSGHVAITSRGVAGDDRIVAWEDIAAVRRDREGVELRLSRAEGRANPRIGGTGCAVPDARLAEVVEFYLLNPHRRSALDTGPDRLVLPPAAIPNGHTA